MLKRNAIALAISGLSVLAGCSTVSAPARPALPERAGKIEPVMTVRDSRGVDSEGMYRIGRYFQGQMRYDDAVAAYRKALALDARNVEARNALGVVYSIQGMSAEAEGEFKAAIAIAPGLSHLQGNLGYHYLQSGRYAEARSALHEAIRLNPANALAWKHVAIAERNLTAARAPASASAEPGPAAAMNAAPASTALAAAAPDAAPVEAVSAEAAKSASATTALTIESKIAPVGADIAPVPARSSLAAARAPDPEESATVVQAAIEPAPVAGGAQAIEVRDTAPVAQLTNIAPNVWELRPQAVEVAVPAAVAVAAQAAVTRIEPSAPQGIPSSVRLEIANGNGVTALAKSVGRYLRTLGASQPRLTNQRPFSQGRTEIQYVAGADQWAQALRRMLKTPAELVPTRRIERNAQLRLVLGKDFHEIEAVARLRLEVAKPVVIAENVPRR